MSAPRKFRPFGLPPPELMDAYRGRLPPLDAQALQTVFIFRTAAQQIDNTLGMWFEDTAGSPARFQILALLWISMPRAVAYQEVVAALGVTRATVSGLMIAMERDGLIQSAADPADRRKLLATLTAKGETVIEQARATNIARLRNALKGLSPTELETFAGLLQRVRDGFIEES